MKFVEAAIPILELRPSERLVAPPHKWCRSTVAFEISFGTNNHPTIDNATILALGASWSHRRGQDAVQQIV